VSAKERRILECLRLQRRILRNVEVDSRTGCWLWAGRRNNCGYGVMTVRVKGYRSPRPIFAHRASWEAFRFRRMPRTRQAAHSLICTSRACCNWAHIRATTASHNRRDVERKKQLQKNGGTSWGRKIRLDWPPLHTVLACG
jgi:hypothetical protein